MKKIRRKIKSAEAYDKMLGILCDRVKDNKPISKNGMLDGLIIGFLVSSKRFALDLFLDREMGSVLDGTIQRLEHIITWVSDNEEELCRIMV